MFNISKDFPLKWKKAIYPFWVAFLRKKVNILFDIYSLNNFCNEKNTYSRRWKNCF